MLLEIVQKDVTRTLYKEIIQKEDVEGLSIE
jgi:hypothetical protein